MNCDAFFFTNSAKTPFYLHSIYALCSILVAQSGCRSGFESGLVLEFFCFRASRSWFRTSLSPYFFSNKRVAENIPVFSGRLVFVMLLFLTMQRCTEMWNSRISTSAAKRIKQNFSDCFKTAN